ncbi:pyridoxamine 5'-phosphate oxidase family protein [Leeuwenhoekiella aequorea]|uniref:General stress protein 26 n=1 Tax=Leeuwenhoekiella aequorea TaxID=283736 RepID=A0A4Q0P4F1_9FLAO|nr:pyridoxamine 5'-phosphate oxidase family protein [Leeuwenhoekiella aequorea]RXG21454.1 general stress protein 26 [Leeuwenhoekiella aequorea]|tara:strand:- start:426 stop:926 length:501 start_codon:yes stop_codon:yes gene_type:complete
MSTENLSNTDAINKLKDLATSIDFAMMVTNLSNKPLDAIPMSTKKVDEVGNIWFLSGADSDHNANIAKDADMQLLYAKPSDMQFLSVFGKAFVTRDKAILEELYSTTDDSWFDGVEDPNLTAIKFTPSQAQYWDTKNNKFVSLLKMGYAAVTGDKVDVGETGSLNL